MAVELTDEHMDAHGGAGGSYDFFTKCGMTLRYDVSKSDPLPNRTIQNIKIKSNMQNPQKSQFSVWARALKYSRLRSAGHTKCNCALRTKMNHHLRQS